MGSFLSFFPFFFIFSLQCKNIFLPLIDQAQGVINKKKFFTGYRSAGFLAYLSADVEVESTNDPILFDREKYDYGDNYNPSTGIYTVPYDGQYEIHVRVNGLDFDACHMIRVDGNQVTYTSRYDPDESNQASSTSIVIPLVTGQELTVNPCFIGTVHGSTINMPTTFGAILLYGD